MNELIPKNAKISRFFGFLFFFILYYTISALINAASLIIVQKYGLTFKEHSPILADITAPTKDKGWVSTCTAFIWNYGLSHVPFFSFLLVFVCLEWHLEKTYFSIGSFIHHITSCLIFHCFLLEGNGVKITWESWCLVLPKINQCASTLVFAQIRHQFIRICAVVVTSTFTNLEWSLWSFIEMLVLLRFATFSFMEKAISGVTSAWLAVDRVVCLSIPLERGVTVSNINFTDRMNGGGIALNTALKSAQEPSLRHIRGR